MKSRNNRWLFGGDKSRLATDVILIRGRMHL